MEQGIPFTVEEAVAFLGLRFAFADKAEGRELELLQNVCQKADELKALAMELLAEIKEKGVTISNPYLAGDKDYMARLAQAEKDVLRSIINRLEKMDI